MANILKPFISAAVLAAFVLILPQTANAQRPSLGGIDQKLNDIQQQLCSLPNAPDSCFTNRIVFVTSTVHAGDFGGVVAGDTICNSHALAAGLPGRYRVWLSDGVGSPNSRFTQSTQPYVRPDGVTVADNYTDLTDGTLDAGILVDETGNLLAGGVVWTATLAAGVPAGSTCSDWTTRSTGSARLGAASQTTFRWTNATDLNCGIPAHLYCFQQ